MWRKNSWSLAIIFIFILSLLGFSSLVLGLRINEVELNPEGEDSGNEWIELYSDETVFIENIKIKNYDNDTVNLNEIFPENFNFSNYLIINLSSQFLDNSNEKVFLIENNSIIYQTGLFSDSGNNNKTWQYCENEWNFTDSTYNQENVCNNDGSEENKGEDGEEENPEIDLEFEFDEDEINNKEEFEIEVLTYNLKDKDYDLKIFLTFEDNDTIISEIYDENNDDWKSGIYYIDETITGPGNKSEKFELRIDEDYKDYRGGAKLIARLRGTGDEEYIEFDKKNIDILDKEDSIDTEIKSNDGETQEQKILNSTAKNDEVIYLKNNKTKDIKSQEVFLSTNEKIKLFAVYGFALFCVFVIVFLIMKKI